MNSDRSIRLLFFSNEFPNPLHPRQGTFNRGVIHALAADHPLRVICPVSWWDEFKCWMKTGKRIDRRQLHLVDGVRTSYPRFYYPPKLLRSHYDSFLKWSVQRELNEVIRQFRPQAILSYWAHPDGAVAAEMARRENIPSVIMVGGSDVLLLTKDAGRRRAIETALNSADAVVTVSEDIRQKLIQVGIPQERLHVVQRGVDTSVFHRGSTEESRRKLEIPSDRPVLVSVGRLVDVKGLCHLLEAARRLRERNVCPRIYFVGDGPLRQQLKKQAHSCGLADAVHFVGAQNQSLLADWYRAADYVVLPSLSEGIPNVLLEALHCGARFIASHVGGIPEIADPNFDRLVPPGDAAALADAIEEQLQLPVYPGDRWFLPQTWDQSAEKLMYIIRTCRSKNVQQTQAHHRQAVDLEVSPA
ncbi:MAG: glycosyltransferase [Planctomycetaceae bacterium]